MYKKRDLLANKAYRDSVKKWGEPEIPRKRVIIAPLMAGAVAKNVNLRNMERNDKGLDQLSTPIINADKLFKQMQLETNTAGKSELANDYSEYKSWLEKQKKLRADLNGFGLDAKWLEKKTHRSVLEDRVLKRMQEKPENLDGESSSEEEQEAHVIATPPPLTKAQMKLLPLLKQPLPMAMSIIAEYCHNNKLRLLDLFTEVDKDKDWSISRDELCKLVRYHEIPLSDAHLEEMIIALDVDNNDQLEYRELAHGVEVYRVDQRWKKIKELMDMDVDATRKEGAIGSDETVDRKALAASPNDGTHSRRGQRRVSAKLKVCDESDDYSDFSDASVDLLKLPEINTAIKTDATAIKVREKRLRKHKQRKEKQKKQMQKPTAGKGYSPSTMQGPKGEIKDKYTARTVNNVNESLDMMHRSGIPIREDAVKRVLLHPFDKPVDVCRANLRQPGTDLIPASKFDKSRQQYQSVDNSNLARGGMTQKGAGSGRQKASSNHRTRRSSRKQKKKQRNNAFWTDATSPSLSIDDLDRRTPTDSVFRVIKTPLL
eukprot:gene6196-6911_t